MDYALAKIGKLLAEKKANEASDYLFEFVLEMFGRPVAVNLPPNVHMISPEIVITHLRKTIKKLSDGLVVNEPLSVFDDNHVSEEDMNLILKTSDEYEDQQQAYIPGEEQLDRYDNYNSQSQIIPDCPNSISSESLRPDRNFFDTFIDINNTKCPDENYTASETSPEVGDSASSEEDPDSDFFFQSTENLVEFVGVDDELFFTSDDLEDFLFDEDTFYEEDADDADERDNLRIVDSSGISREERSWQMASQLGDHYGWDSEGICLLQEIFMERGWGQTQVAMKHLIDGGMTQDQLLFAKELKENWDQRSELTIAFYKYRRDQSDATYSGEKILSWRSAVEIVNRFSGCIDFEEIDQFIEEALDAWYPSSRLRNDYRSFQQYLRELSEKIDCMSANILDFEPVEERHSDLNDYLFNVLKVQLKGDY